PRDEAESSAELSTVVLQALQDVYEGQIEMRRVEFVGPQVGEELTEQGILAVVYALIGIFLYVMMRFQWRFSVGAVTALVHDVMITMGIISLIQIEFDLTVVAALLAVIGYSLNDTIVLFDRIRENFPKLRSHSPIEVVNTSVNETLSRTLMTSLTTLLVLIALFSFGGEIIHAFAFTLIIGVLVGTYSSIYVASTTLLELGVSKFDLMQVEKEGSAQDSMP
ncbi:MAG: protein translocase subunit SecF, partial [Xanthomonadales bacterium]|nr:protein translocase subunit SecF [Xanthomonadales bacterium]